MSELCIIIIEDSEKHAIGIKDSYEKMIKNMEEKGFLQKYFSSERIFIEWMKGRKKETERNGEEYWFYDESIYREIEEKITGNADKNMRTGILLDVALSKEEYDKASVNDYFDFKIAKEIYRRFSEQANIYVITSIREFSARVLSLMGTKDLIQRYVSKDLVTEYPSYGAMARTIWYMEEGEKVFDNARLDKREDEVAEFFENL